MQKVIGVGGVFFKAKDPDTLTEWYKTHLGIEFQYGFFEFKWADEPATKASGSTSFAIFKEDNAEFNPSTKDFMINFQVADLNSLLAKLKGAGSVVSSKVQEADFGRFGWVVDPEGNKLQLWEPANK